MRNALERTTERIVDSVAFFLPGLFVLFLAVVVSAIVAWVVRWVLERALRGIQFDTRVADWGFGSLADWSPGRSPSRLAGRAVAWSIIILGVLAGMTALEANFTSLLAFRLLDYVPNLAAALLILIFGTLFSRFLARGVLIGAVNMHLPAARLLSLGAKWLVMVLASAMALDHLKIGGAIVDLAFAILFGGIVFALALAVGLGSKDMVSRSLERQSQSRFTEEEETFPHL
jgi:hypothetical protein